MKTSTIAAVLALSCTSNAFPFSHLLRFGRRQVLSQLNDVDILRYALTLEHLEDKFYREGLANFTQTDFANAGFDQTFYQNIQAISAHETAHVQFLTAGLQAAGQTPTVECTYAFGVTDVKGFVALASVLEGVGISAYLGAAAQIANKGYLTAAASILTIESRHSSYIRASLAESPFPQSESPPLTPDEVHTLAHGFIVSCPTGNPTFPVRAFPGLAVTTAGPITSGQVIDVQTTGYTLAQADSSAHLYAAFVSAGGPIFTRIGGQGSQFQVAVPAGVNGQSYLVLTNCNETVSDGTVIAGPALLEITNDPRNITASG